jgi:hypothetical protein
MKVKGSQVGWGFWLQWVLFSTVGFIICFFVLFILGYVVFGDVPDYSFLHYFVNIMLFILVGAGAGIIQWRILGRRVSRVSWWAPAIVAGMVLASVLLYALPIAMDYFLEFEHRFAFRPSFSMIWALGGTLAGVFQWFFLRRHISRAGWWVLASAVGWSLCAVVWEEFNRFLFERFGFVPGGVIGFLQLLNTFGLFSGIIMGAVTGGALVWLLRQTSWSVNHSGCELVAAVRLFGGTRLTPGAPYGVTDSRRRKYSIVMTPPCSLLMVANIIYKHVSTGRG